MLKQVFTWNLCQHFYPLGFRHPPQKTEIPEFVKIQVDTESTEETLPVHERNRHPHRRRYQRPLGDGAKHVAKDGWIFLSFPCRSFPFLGQNGYIIVQDKTQQKEPYRWDDEEADPIAVVVLWHTGAAELKGRVHLGASKCHDSTDPIHERFLVGL